MAIAADPAQLFEQQIRPLLNDRCIECHGPKKQKGELRLDAKAFAFKGSHDGAVIVPGKPAESSLLQRVRSDDPDEQMPPKGERLTTAQLTALQSWIEQGAPWPETDADRAAAHDTRLGHWAWQPVRRPEFPATSEPTRNPIDAFLAAKLTAAGRRFSPEADRRTLIRRLSFDLLGLPPTPEEVTAFEADKDPQAYEKLVDRLLASPHYGERWARHWLDLAHYADTHGFERDQLRPNAWRYRDYVVRALNADKPYDRFLREQIAGDALWPNDPEAITATGFLAAGPWDYVGQVETKSDTLRRAARADDLDDMVTQVMTAACGVTINCARCHDHKLDPISQREYYSLWAVFAGVKRAERVILPVEEKDFAAQRTSLERELRGVRTELAQLRGQGYDLADIVGGGDGLGSGKRGQGIDVLTGKAQTAKRGFLSGVVPNRFVKSTLPLIDGLVVPAGGEVKITSTGLTAHDVPKTSGQVWDAIRHGPVNSQFTTKLGDIDYAGEGHTLLALHANAAITFDLSALRQSGAPAELRLRATAGYFGQTPRNGASYRVFLDGEAKIVREGIGHADGPSDIDLPIPSGARFLTLMATDNGNGIGHDQICFADARVEPAQLVEANAASLQALITRRAELTKRLKTLPEPAKMYGITTEAPPEVKVLRRGDPEQAAEAVAPGALHCVAGIPADFGSGELAEAQRRIALAEWIVNPANPLTRRVLVNRLWHYHFGTGLVDTPSDFGLGGGKPTHPELLDWLAEEFAARGWSLKAMHRLICTSAAYRQQSLGNDPNDSNNRLLGRMNPRRLDAESLRDAVLAVSGKLNRQMFGPGFRDFDYEEAYAPVYRYITANRPELWRRSVYRFVVRTTTHQFLTTLDCPNPANFTPARNVTTTALQSLALLNNGFMLKQAGYFAERVAAEAGSAPEAQATRAFALAFSREPLPQEITNGATFIRAQGLAELCRQLLNANEFVYVD